MYQEPVFIRLISENSPFRPFHRITQLIIYPRDQRFILLPNISRSNFDDYFGPIYNQTFLAEAFKLYRSLIDLEVDFPDSKKKITLNDICYKPLNPDNKNCGIMSVFNYFQVGFSPKRVKLLFVIFTE